MKNICTVNECKTWIMTNVKKIRLKQSEPYIHWKYKQYKSMKKINQITVDIQIQNK